MSQLWSWPFGSRSNKHSERVARASRADADGRIRKAGVADKRLEAVGRKPEPLVAKFVLHPGFVVLTEIKDQHTSAWSKNAPRFRKGFGRVLGVVQRLRRNPMFRALRLDKLMYAALEHTLRHLLFCRWEEIPALRMISLSAEEIRGRAEALCGRLTRSGLSAKVIPGLSVIGGGSTPNQALPTFVVAIYDEGISAMERGLRAGDPAVVARVEDDRLVLDLRTVFENEEEELIGAMSRVRDSSRPTSIRE